MKKMIIILCLLLLTACGGSNTKIIDVMNGLGTEKIGEMSYTKMPKDEVTDEYLVDWQNDIKENDYNWGIIEYSDDEYVGIYGSSTMILKNVFIRYEKDGTYTYEERENTEYYYVSDGKLIKE